MSDACGACLGRREFLAKSAMFAAAAAALSACGLTDATGPQLSSSVDITVADHPSLATVGGIALVTAGGERLAIVRTGATSYVALSRVCPHQGATVGVNGSGFRCPEHGATFNSTGTWTGGEHTSNMHAYSTSFNATTGVLTVAP
jgi:Rieske Fe-S protein